MILEILKHKYMKMLFQIFAVVAICLLFKPVSLCYSQNDICNKFEFVNLSGNTYTTIKPLKSKKVKLEPQYNYACSYDFNGDGYVEEIYSRLDQQSAGFLLQSKNKNIDLNYKFYIDDGVPKFNDDGIWIFIIDVVGDSNPEIVVFSLFTTNTCSLSIIKYDKAKGSFIKKDYGLDDMASNPHMLVKNKKVIHNSYGSQGLYDEIHFSDDDFDESKMYYYLTVTNTHSSPRNISIEGKYIGQVSGHSTKTFKLKRTLYGKISSVQASGYLLSPNKESGIIQNKPNANDKLTISF